jgi:ATP-binding cassette subfamily C (CFTR/MRP) protein 1
VKRGEFVGVAGAVGSGKSSLLEGILGEMVRVRGSVHVNGTVAYVSQEAWIENGTVRDNICFGAPYNAARFASVVDACALTRDLEQLSARDLTEIGERGINLSGGQKIRISLARAVYQGMIEQTVIRVNTAFL